MPVPAAVEASSTSATSVSLFGKGQHLMNLDDFESYIDRRVYLRGYDYYENDHIASVKRTGENTYVAEVEGANTYTVEVRLDESLNIIEAFCDCPFDIGEYCKHQVAVFLALRDMKHGTADEGRDIQQILASRTQEELVAFLLKLAVEDEGVSRRIQLEFAATDGNEEMREAISLIQSYIRDNSDRHGFVGYRGAANAVYGAELVLEKAAALSEQKESVRAVDLALCGIREMVNLVQSADDSDGVIGGVIEDGFSLIDDIIEDAELGLSDKSTLFENLMQECADGRYDGWIDWRLQFLEICSRMADVPELRTRLEQQMTVWAECEDADSWSDNYLAERLNQIRYNVILQNDRAEEAQKFVQSNLQFSTFREMAIVKAMQEKDYDQVIELALAGEAKDKGSRGLIDNWKGYRYRAYQLANRIDEQRELALDFILDGSYDFYSELKETYSADEWAGVYPQIILSLESQGRFYNDIYTRILIEEGERAKLLEYVKQNPWSVGAYYEHLLPAFKEEVYGIFLENIERTAAGASNRGGYQRVCDIIRDLIKAGGNDQAQEIKQTLYNRYARRPAFRDELSRI